MKTRRVLLCVVVVWGSIFCAAEANKEPLKTPVQTVYSNSAAETPPSIMPKDLRTESQGREKLAEGSKGEADRAHSYTEVTGFTENTAKDMTRVFTEWLEAARKTKDGKEKLKAYHGAIRTAKYFQEYFNDLPSKVSFKSSQSFTYHIALNEKVEDIIRLGTSLELAEKSMKPKFRLSERLKSSSRKREEAGKMEQAIDLQHRIEVACNLNSLQRGFNSLLEHLKTLDEESYQMLNKLNDNVKLSADEGNKILDDIIEKWEKEEEKEKQNLDNISPKQLKYDDLKDEELFIYFPLLHARKYGSPHDVAQLLSHIKSTLIDNRSPANEENSGTSSSVAVDDELFYEVIIPQVLLAYVHDEGIRKAEEFVELTEGKSYNLYDTDDRRNWPVRYFEYLVHIEKYNSSETVFIKEPKNHPENNYHIMNGYDRRSTRHHSRYTHYWRMCTSEKKPPIPHSQTIKELVDVYRNINKLKYGKARVERELTLVLVPSDYDKRPKLVEELQSKVEK